MNQHPRYHLPPNRLYLGGKTNHFRAKMDENNPVFNPSYARALESARLRGLRGEQFTTSTLLDLVETRHGSRAYRQATARCGTLDICPPSEIARRLRASFINAC